MNVSGGRIGRPIRIAVVAIAVVGVSSLAVTHYLKTHPSGFDLSSDDGQSILPPGTALIPGTGYAGKHLETEDG